MKPFNLETALNGAPITDREGKPVEFIAYVEKASNECQVVTLHSDEVVSIFSVFSNNPAITTKGTNAQRILRTKGRMVP